MKDDWRASNWRVTTPRSRDREGAVAMLPGFPLPHGRGSDGPYQM